MAINKKIKKFSPPLILPDTSKIGFGNISQISIFCGQIIFYGFFETGDPIVGGNVEYFSRKKARTPKRPHAILETLKFVNSQ